MRNWERNYFFDTRAVKSKYVWDFLLMLPNQIFQNMLIKKEKKTIFCFKIRKINITYIKCKKYSAKRIKGKSINISSTYTYAACEKFYIFITHCIFVYVYVIWLLNEKYDIANYNRFN